MFLNYMSVDLRLFYCQPKMVHNHKILTYMFYGTIFLHTPERHSRNMALAQEFLTYKRMKEGIKRENISLERIQISGET